ncbi:MAG: M20 family metallopeptidase [Flavobacteriales bacterium]
MMEVIPDIRRRAAELLEDAIKTRRHLHSHPELSFCEEKTSAFISQKLREIGIAHQTGIAGYGITGIIKGKGKGKTVALRADMDALPIEESGEKACKSLQAGVMHACGHDVHMASLLGTARILNELSGCFNGCVKLIFQPAEELLPGGALGMIEAGVLENPPVDYIIAQHVDPTLETGKIGIRAGAYMASNDELYITVNGEGGHAALADQDKNPVFLFAEAVTALRDAVKTAAQAENPHVLSIGKVTAKGATNVVPETLRAEGTFRTFDEQWRAEAKKIMRTAVASATDGRAAIKIVSGYPCLVNDPSLSEIGFALARDFLGNDRVIALDKRMTAEDFARYAQEVPALFYRLGVGNREKGITSGLHTPTFDVDEQSLATGMGLMAHLVIGALS